MTAYLIEHPPAQRQFRRPRRATPSGVCVVHTAENTPDTIGPDGAAEAVARFIAGRSDFGSYHDLVDSDSIINLVPYDAEAYHDGTGSNPHSYGVSAATQAAQWPAMPAEWRRDTVRNMAKAAARYARWIRTEHGIVVPARRITRAESEARKPGFLAHGDRDPGRRTDPGREFPWPVFLAEFDAALNPTDPAVTTRVELARDDVAAAIRHLNAALTKGDRGAQVEAFRDDLKAALSRAPKE